MASSEDKTKNKLRYKSVMIGFGAMLILATLTSAYSVWQAASYTSSASTDLVISNGKRTEASEYLNYGLQQEQVDIGMWLQWASAKSQNNTLLANFIEERFRDEFKPAFYAWGNSTNSTGIPPGTPFSIPEYKNANIEKSRSISQEVVQLENSATLKSEYGNKLTLMTVLMASIIVICGFESRMRTDSLKLPILLTVIAIYIIAVVLILQVPPLWRF